MIFQVKGQRLSILALAVLSGMGLAYLLGLAAHGPDLATITTSVLGAFVAVAGALWVMQEQLRHSQRTAATLLSQALTPLQDTCHAISNLQLQTDPFEDETGKKLLKLAVDLKDASDALQFFEPFSQIQDYKSVRGLHKIKGLLSEQQPIIAKETRWLSGNGHAVSMQVVNNALRPLKICSDELSDQLDPCLEELRKLAK